MKRGEAVPARRLSPGTLKRSASARRREMPLDPSQQVAEGRPHDIAKHFYGVAGGAKGLASKKTIHR
jgi:hypothetical protein